MSVKLIVLDCTASLNVAVGAIDTATPVVPGTLAYRWPLRGQSEYSCPFGSGTERARCYRSRTLSISPEK